MPTYDYHCEKCGHSFEVSHKITAEPLKTCPQCNEDTLRRGPGGGIGLAFSGKDFYINEYGLRKKSETPPAEAEKPAPKEKSGGCCPCGKDQSSCSK